MYRLSNYKPKMKNKIKKKDVNFNVFYEECMGEITFNMIPCNKHKVYKILIKDFNNHAITEYRDSNYMIFDVQLLSGFETLELDITQLYKLNIPAKGFTKAWSNAKGKGVLNKNKLYDIELSFIRKSRNYMVISDLKIMEVNL